MRRAVYQASLKGRRYGQLTLKYPSIQPQTEILLSGLWMFDAARECRIPAGSWARVGPSSTWGFQKMNAKQRPAAHPASAVNSAATSIEVDTGDKMDQIRELMFGGVTRDFDRRLKDLGEHLESGLSRISEEFDKRFAALEARYDPQLERINAQLRQETAARTSAIDDVDVRFSQALRTQRGEINAVLQQHEDNAASAETRARDSLAQLEDRTKAALLALKEALSVARTELGGEKLAREDLADLMAEVSLRLRGIQDVSKGG